MEKFSKELSWVFGRSWNSRKKKKFRVCSHFYGSQDSLTDISQENIFAILLFIALVYEPPLFLNYREF